MSYDDQLAVYEKLAAKTVRTHATKNQHIKCENPVNPWLELEESLSRDRAEGREEDSQISPRARDVSVHSRMLPVAVVVVSVFTAIAVAIHATIF